MTDLHGYDFGSGEGQAWWFLDTLMTVKAGGLDTHDSFTQIEFRAPIGFGPHGAYFRRNPGTSCGQGGFGASCLWL